MRVGQVVSAIATIGVLASAALAQERYYSDWVEFFYNPLADAHFYYSPSSVYRIDQLRQVEITDTQPVSGKVIVDIVHMNCAARTFQVTSDKYFDSTTHAFLYALKTGGKEYTVCVDEVVYCKIFAVVC